jgi:hypothetical protein
MLSRAWIIYNRRIVYFNPELWLLEDEYLINDMTVIFSDFSVCVTYMKTSYYLSLLT